MKASVLLATLAVMIVVPASAKEIEVPDGSVPEIRPCIDIVARGDLRSIGEPESLVVEDSVLAQETYTWRFIKRDVLVGRMQEASRNLSRTDHALVWPQPPVDDVLVLLAKRRGGIAYMGSLRVDKDERGRAFVPIFHPDDMSEAIRARDWRPAALMDFAKPVAHVDDVQDDGGPRVVARLYLEDIPALLAAARDEDCWR